MPSSSNGTTHVEKTLVAHFRKVYVHLRLSARRDELDYLIDHFIGILDLSDTRLQYALYPASLPLQERAKAHADIAMMNILGRASKALKLFDRIYEAGNACGNMGWLLKQAGRQKEGEQWCEFDRLLEMIAWQVSDEEKAKAAAMRSLIHI